MSRRLHIVLSGAVLALMLAGCSSASPTSGTGSGANSGASAGDTNTPTDPPTDKGVAPDTATPSPVVPPTSAPAPSTRASTPPAGLRDFSDVTFATPSGFTASSSYSPLTALESDYVSHFLVPTDSSDTKEVIGLYVYTLPAAKTVTSRTNQVALIKAYNAKAKAVSTSAITPAVSPIDGVPAYTQTATEPGNFTYIAYWAFGTHHFLQYSCQLGATSGLAELTVACGATLASMQLN